MPDTISRLWLIAIVAVLLLAPGNTGAQDFTIFSDFNADTPGLPPATGGPDQPTAVVNGGVTVETSANGIPTQPLVVDDGSCNQAYFGGVYYDLATPITAGSLRVEATVAANQLTDGVFFDTDVSTFGASIARLSIADDGTIIDHFGVVMSSYAPNTPVRFRADIDMDRMLWSCTVDDDLNGFADDPVISGLPFVNPPAVIPALGTVAFNFFGSFNSCTGSRVMAYDDILIVSFLPIFVDGFESGTTLEWSTTVP